MIGPAGLELDLDLVRRIERHAVDAWPPTVRREAPGGWLLRATPGLDRGRSNNALTPARELEDGEIRRGLEHVRAFAAEHGVSQGVQVSPAALHGPLLRELDARGWAEQVPVLVLAGAREAAAGSVDQPALDLDVQRDAGTEWLEAWAACEGRHDVEAHARTVFAQLAGRARFARSGRDAVGIAVEGGGLVGLFCLAVAPDRRRRGLGAALVRGLLRGCSAPLVYLQVQEDNVPALQLYDRLGFEVAYSYRHFLAP